MLDVFSKDCLLEQELKGCCIFSQSRGQITVDHVVKFLKGEQGDFFVMLLCLYNKSIVIKDIFGSSSV